MCFKISIQSKGSSLGFDEYFHEFVTVHRNKKILESGQVPKFAKSQNFSQINTTCKLKKICKDWYFFVCDSALSGTALSLFLSS